MSVPLFAPKVRVDWGADGSFTGPYDDVTADTAADPGVTIDTGRDGARALNPPKVPAATFELRNDHARYSHENPASPVYQRVRPGTPCTISVGFGSVRLYRANVRYRATVPYRGVADWRVATTRLDEASQDTALGAQRVKITTLGASSTLVGRAVTVPIQQNILTSLAVTLLLDAAGWPAGSRAISTGDTTLLWFWADERSCWDALMDVVGAEGAGAALYEDAMGTLHFENRNYRAVASRSVTSQAAFTDRRELAAVRYRAAILYRGNRPYRGAESPLYFTSLQYEPGWRVLYSRATYSTRRRATGALGVVWSAGGDIVLGPSASQTLFARPNDPFLNAVSPALTTDYLVASGSATVTLTASSGAVAIIVVTAGAGGCRLTGPTGAVAGGLQLRAQPLPVVSQAVVQSTVATSSSDSLYRGVQTLSVAGWPEVDLPMAEAVCNSWATRYQSERPSVSMAVYAGDHAHFEQIVQRQTSDRISIRETNTGLQTDVWIESRELAIVGGGGRHLTAVWGCEKVDALIGFVWDGATTLWDSALWGS